MHPPDAVILAKYASEVQGLTTAEETKMLATFAKMQQMPVVPKKFALFDLLAQLIAQRETEIKAVAKNIGEKVGDSEAKSTLLVHAAHYLFTAKQQMNGGETMSPGDLYGMEVCGRACAELAGAKYAGVGREVMAEARVATGLPLSDSLRKYTTLDRDLNETEVTFVRQEVVKAMELKKLSSEVVLANNTSLGVGGNTSITNGLPLCKAYGAGCYSYQQGKKCSHVPRKHKVRFGEKGQGQKRKWKERR